MIDGPLMRVYMSLFQHPRHEWMCREIQRLHERRQIEVNIHGLCVRIMYADILQLLGSRPLNIYTILICHLQWKY